MKRVAATGVAFWSVLAALVAAGVVWRTYNIRDAFGAAVAATHQLHTPGVVQQVSAWGRSRAALAESIAALLAHDFSRDLAVKAPSGRASGNAGQARAIDPASALALRFRAAMDVLARREGFVAGYIVDLRGMVLATALAPTHPPHDLPGAIVVDGRSTGQAVPAAWGADASRRIPTLAVPCGAGYCAEFRAPILVDGAAVAAVVLLAPVGDTTFPTLNTRRADVQTLRTSVLAQRRGPHDAPSVLAVVATEGGPGARAPDSFYASAALPSHVRRALRRAPGELEIDTAPGRADN
ncbi:MAG TPA: hypothetical protein VE869_07710 [Gemmatimonas sp.]|nr:hypothetical protein [Gemmatimonas sp.]